MQYIKFCTFTMTWKTRSKIEILVAFGTWKLKILSLLWLHPTWWKTSIIRLLTSKLCPIHFPHKNTPLGHPLGLWWIGLEKRVAWALKTHSVPNGWRFGDSWYIAQDPQEACCLHDITSFSLTLRTSLLTPHTPCSVEWSWDWSTHREVLNSIT